MNNTQTEVKSEVYHSTRNRIGYLKALLDGSWNISNEKRTEIQDELDGIKILLTEEQAEFDVMLISSKEKAELMEILKG